MHVELLGMLSIHSLAFKVEICPVPVHEEKWRSKALNDVQRHGGLIERWAAMNFQDFVRSLLMPLQLEDRKVPSY